MFKKIVRSSLQLSQFIDKYFNFDNAKINILYSHDDDCFFVSLLVIDESKIYNLVSQKNEYRKFSSMKAVFNILPLSSGEVVELNFESSVK